MINDFFDFSNTCMAKEKPTSTKSKDKSLKCFVKFIKQEGLDFYRLCKNNGGKIEDYYTIKIAVEAAHTLGYNITGFANMDAVQLKELKYYIYHTYGEK